MMYAYHERDCWPHMIKPRGLCASWKKSFSLANKQKSELFFCISLELFINALFFDRRRSWAALVIFRNTFNLKGNLRLISL